MNFSLRLSSNRGFTLLEVLLSLGILASMMMAISSILRSTFEVRKELSNKSTVTHRVNLAMENITSDLAHTYVLSPKITYRVTGKRSMGTIFQIERASGSSPSLRLTTQNHRSTKYNTYESDIALVEYTVQESKLSPGRFDLHRGFLAHFGKDMKLEIKSEVLARNVKSMQVEFWNGEKWLDDKWNSNRGEQRGKMPHMVRITLEAWVNDLEEDLPPEPYHEETMKYATTVMMPYALSTKELKDSGKVKL